MLSPSPLPSGRSTLFSEFSLGPRFRHFLPPSRQDPPLSNPQTCQTLARLFLGQCVLDRSNLARAVACPVLSCPVPSRLARPRPVFGFQLLFLFLFQFLGVGKWSVQKCHHRCPCPLPPARRPPASHCCCCCYYFLHQSAGKQTQQVSASYPVDQAGSGTVPVSGSSLPNRRSISCLSCPPATTLDDATVRYAALPHASSLPYLTLPDCYLTLPCTHAGSSLCPVQLHCYIPLTHCLPPSNLNLVPAWTSDAQFLQAAGLRTHAPTTTF